MGTDAHQKSVSRSASKATATKNKLQMIAVFVAFTFVWIQVHSNFNINDLMELDQISTTTYTKDEKLHSTTTTLTRGLLTDEDRDFIQDNSMSSTSSSSSGKKTKTTTKSNNKISSSSSTLSSAASDAAATAAAQAKEVHSLETAKLKAEADKAKAEAEMAKLEAEKLRLEVAKAKLDAEKARAEADKATAGIQAAKDKAALQAKIAAKQAARAEREKFKAEEETRAEKAALQAKIAAKQAARTAEAEKEEEEEAETKKTANAKKGEEQVNEEVSKEEEEEEEESKVEETVENGEEKEPEKVEEEEKETPIVDSKEGKEAAKARLQAKIAAKQAARAEKEAKEKKEKEDAEVGSDTKEKEKKEELEQQQSDNKKVEEEKEKETAGAAADSKDDKEAAKARLRAKIAAKQAARAEKEAAADKGKKDGEKEKKETRPPPVVPKGPNFDNDDTSIRQWGCARNETPFIFVHIGKAGGGGVRSRMAAAAMDYDRPAWYRVQDDKSYYYPVYDSEGMMHRGKFESSKMTNWVPKNFTEIEKDFAFEGFAPCAATTPLGQALSCPMPSQWCGPNNDDTNNRCDLVYMGHNVLGSELHWLPTNYLVDWWKTTDWGMKKDDYIKYLFKDRFKGGGGEFGEWDIHVKPRRLMKYKYPDMSCPPGPLIYRDFKKHYDKCAAPKEPWLDEVTQITTGTDPVIYGSQVISSMPVMRVTVLRDPFSWLTSKFFWHPYHFGKDGKQVSPDSGKKKNDALIADAKKKKTRAPNFIKCDDIDQAANGWASLRALTYIFYLCGEHCMGGYKKGTMTIDDLERQAAYNLRHSFAVVGLLQKTDDFYDMVEKRVYYMNMHLNPEVKGKEHSSGKNEENLRCKEVYKDPDFQTKMMAASPALAALYRLYQVAVEVNEFQQKELAECAAE